MKGLILLAGPALTGLMGIFMHPCVLFGWKAPDMGFLAWFYLVPLFLVILKTEGRHIFKYAFVASFIFYAGCLYWMQLAMKNFGGLSPIISALVLGLVVLMLALLFAVALKIACTLSVSKRVPFFLLAALALALQDYLRVFFPVNGFPWVLPAYSQGTYLSLFQWVQFTGVHGLNLLIYLVNALLAETFFFLWSRNRDGMIRSLAVVCLLMVTSLAAQFFLVPLMKIQEAGHSTKIALVQGNIPQDEKWDSARARANLKAHLNLTDRAAIEGAQLAVWPETAYPFAVEKNQFMLASGELKIPTVVGAVTDAERNIFNSAYLLDADAKVSAVYHKRHLVPFGEYVPLKEYLTFARRLTQAVGDFEPGTTDDPILFYNLNLGMLICYEDIFPELARLSVLRGANVLVNLTNDAWYGDTSAQWQHVVFSQFRALENARYLVRATNTGITAFISPRGEVLARMNPFEPGFLSYPIRTLEEATFYTRHGDFIMWMAAVFMGIAVLDHLLSRFVKGVSDVARNKR